MKKSSGALQAFILFWMAAGATDDRYQIAMFTHRFLQEGGASWRSSAERYAVFWEVRRWLFRVQGVIPPPCWSDWCQIASTIAGTIYPLQAPYKGQIDLDAPQTFCSACGSALSISQALRERTWVL